MNDYRNGGMDMNGGSVAGSLAGFAIGAIVGAGIALLFAPDSGTRTRQRLGASAQKLGRVAGEKIDAAKSVVQEFGTDAKEAFKAGKETFVQGRERRTGFEQGQGEFNPREEATH